jgi:hypothetical protein
VCTDICACVGGDELYTVVRPKTAVAANLITKREKQIAKGKNTTGYRRYVLEVPRFVLSVTVWHGINARHTADVHEHRINRARLR